MVDSTIAIVVIWIYLPLRRLPLKIWSPANYLVSSAGSRRENKNSQKTGMKMSLKEIKRTRFKSNLWTRRMTCRIIWSRCWNAMAKSRKVWSKVSSFRWLRLDSRRMQISSTGEWNADTTATGSGLSLAVSSWLLSWSVGWPVPLVQMIIESVKSSRKYQNNLTEKL